MLSRNVVFHYFAKLRGIGIRFHLIFLLSLGGLCTKLCEKDSHFFAPPCGGPSVLRAASDWALGAFREGVRELFDSLFPI
jgi:hypothetical protein